MKRFMLGMMFIVLGFVLVFGETYEHKEGGLSIWFPDTWKIKAEENVLEADAPDEDAYVQLLMLEDVETMETAIDALVEELAPIVKNFKLTTEGQEEKFNGLNFYLVEGEGMVEGVKMGVSVVLIATPKEQIGMMTLLCPEVVYKKYEKDFEKIIKNIKAI
ncbi:MAG: hypothetical protein QG657_3874 [Acidobacteriota bacterium]|nr:hypothetical protein [Acidobacteriota bacterium]